MAVKTDSEIRRLEGLFMSLQDDVKEQGAIQREQNKTLALINQNLTQLNVTLMGTPNTEDTGLYGMVSRHGARIDRIEKILWPLVAVLIATNVVSVSSIFWG